MVTKDTPIAEVKDLMRHDGIYHKITKEEIECECFCSLCSCVDEFYKGELVVKTYGNFFHVKCFHGKVKKPRIFNMKKYA